MCVNPKSQPCAVRISKCNEKKSHRRPLIKVNLRCNECLKWFHFQSEIDFFSLKQQQNKKECLNCGQAKCNLKWKKKKTTEEKLTREESERIDRISLFWVPYVPFLLLWAFEHCCRIQCQQRWIGKQQQMFTDLLFFATVVNGRIAQTVNPSIFLTLFSLWLTFSFIRGTIVTFWSKLSISNCFSCNERHPHT